MYIAIQLIVDCIAYWLPGLFNEYLVFSGASDFVSVIFIRTINCVGKLLDYHLKIVSVHTSVYVCVYVCVCVCVSTPRITSGVIWTPDIWLNKFYSCYMATLVSIVKGHGLSIDIHCGN